MKKIAIILLSCMVLNAFGAQKVKPDPVLNADQKQKISAAIPESFLVAPTAKNILVYSNTAGYRHASSIVSFKYLARELEKRSGGKYKFTISDDIANFEKDKLAKFDAIVLNQCTGNFFALHPVKQGGMSAEDKKKMNDKHEELVKNVMEYVENGGAIFGMHGACDANKKNDAFASMMGGRFISHPWGWNNPGVVVLVETPEHELVKGIWPENEFKSRDEIYQLTTGYDRTKQKVLCSLDFERSPVTGINEKNARGKKIHREDHDFGLVWVKDFGKGRISYVAFGHDMQVFFIPEMVDLYVRAIQFTVGDLKADTTPHAKPAK